MKKQSGSEKAIEGLLKEAGIKINGSNPWDFQVKDQRVFKRVLSHGSLGLGEAYMDGWWDAPRLDEFFHKIIAAKLQYKIKLNWHLLSEAIWSRIFNLY